MWPTPVAGIRELGSGFDLVVRVRVRVRVSVRVRIRFEFGDELGLFFNIKNFGE